MLIQDGPLAPGLLKTEVNLPPGVSFSSDQGKTVLLAGGFSSVSPESGFPLSPTLQLNYDLATFSDQELLAIARAELFRITAVNYRSYTVAADNQVAVIGNSVEQLQEFVNTYGGVLAIEPLLVKGYHRDFSTVLELNLDSRGKGCRPLLRKSVYTAGLAALSARLGAFLKTSSLITVAAITARSARTSVSLGLSISMGCCTRFLKCRQS